MSDVVEVKPLLDVLGVEVTVGARVAYAAAGYGHAVCLRVGIVEALRDGKAKVRVQDADTAHARWIMVRTWHGSKMLVL